MFISIFFHYIQDLSIFPYSIQQKGSRKGIVIPVLNGLARINILYFTKQYPPVGFLRRLEGNQELESAGASCLIEGS